MAAIPFNSGDIVWTNFPFEEQPDRPGPVRHAACVIAAFTRGQASVATSAPVDSLGLVVGVYTSSQVQKFGDALPIGVIQVKLDRANRIGDQKSFFIDVRKRAFMPFARQFFPEIDGSSHGLIGAIDRGLWDQVRKQYKLINDRHPELIVNVGPLRPF
jgi:hypothetical protein